MDRRSFLKSSGLTAVGGLAAGSVTATTSLAGVELSSTAKVLRLDLPPVDDDTFDRALTARRISEQLELTTDGGIQVVAAFAGEPADLSLVNVQHLKQANPDWDALMPLVHGLAPQDFDRWHFTGGGEALIEELAHETGIVALPVGRSSTLDKLQAQRPDDSPNLALLDEGEGVDLTQFAGSWQRSTQKSDMNIPTVQQPQDLAGEPVFLTYRFAELPNLSSMDHAILSVIAKAEYGIVAAEADVMARMNAKFGPAAPHQERQQPVPSRLASAIETRRRQIIDRNGLGRRILESHNGFVSMTSPDPMPAPDNTRVS